MSHLIVSAALALLQAGSPAGDCYRVESQRFVFHSDPWINLHHVLFEWARNDPARPRNQRDRRGPVNVVERTELASLSGPEQEAWNAALRLYDERMVARDPLTDPNLVALRTSVSGVACSPTGPDAIAEEIRTVLIEAMPVYRRHWWARHHSANVRWIRMMQDQLPRYESALAEQLSDAYGGAWPRERIRVDVSAYANWSGAYTTNRPDQVTISSTARHYEGLNAVEMVFHEVSHASFFEERLLADLQTAFRKRGARAPAGLSHVIQFLTPYQILRSLLREDDRRDYRAYPELEGVYERVPTWNRFRLALEEHWVPFLAGKGERADALDRVAIQLQGAP